MKKVFVLITILALLCVGIAAQASVTGNPLADGWMYHGNSLADGVYSNGKANYGFDVYSTAISVGAGSPLNIQDGEFSWLTGDTVIGVGGKFNSITASEAGWSAISGNAVNQLLTTATHGPKLQVKLGTSDASWTTSTTAPGSGNGNSSTGNGGVGTVHFRTSGWFHATDPLASQDSETTWSGNSGELMLLDKDDHIRRLAQGGSYINPDTRVARVIWLWDAENGVVDSWQLLLNTSLLDRVSPDFIGATPTFGNLAIVSVQDRDSAYTDAVISTVPEPGTIVAAVGLLGPAALMFRRRKA